jgi:isoleucyl-tRNA synthetase
MDDLKPFTNESENEILNFWKKNKVFEKLVQKNKKNPNWSFLDGPITANNPMGVHHAWGRTYKDLFQRYKAMNGFDERYQNGFDCQGLWVEVEVEKELGFKTKKDIEEYGIEKFVNKCKERVLKYSAIQTEQSIRLGQWMDWDNSYYTMSDENNYAIWHFLKTCHEKGWIYKGYESIPWCPRCETAISQHEILTEDYKELTHESIIMEFPLVDRDREYLLVWTTTPWTIPANIAVAVDKDIEYSLIEGGFNPKDKFWIAKNLIEKIFNKKHGKILKTVKGEDLVGLKYKSAFEDLPAVKKVAIENPETFHKVIATDSKIMPISKDEGTGLVHTAVSAGTEDYRLGKKLGLPMIPVISDNADYLEGFGEFSGKNAKNNPRIILDYLEFRDKKEGIWVFSIFPYKHRYPVCWRCKTELVWKVAEEWYIKMDELRKPMIEITKKIKWLPEFGMKQELDWLKNMEDWLISKKRYWGLALPIYECQCGNIEVIGSKKELKEKAVEGWEDFEGKTPHRPNIDKVKIKCSKCGEKVTRILDVGNPWLDAGIVPYSTLKYFEDKKYWEKWFPAKFICESFPGQFKNWFYSLIAMSTVLENKEPFEKVLGYASVRDDKGEEMHKSKGNAIWFDDAVSKIGADAMRWLFLTTNPFENLNFSYKITNDAKKNLMLFTNVVNFYQTYSKIDNFKISNKNESKNLLDIWIISRLNHTIKKVTEKLEKFDSQSATSEINNFISDVSVWYLRRSRKRRSPDFYQTLYMVIFETNKLLAPFLPFLSEMIYQKIKIDDIISVHLLKWPKFDEKLIYSSLENRMQSVRDIASIVFSIRDENNIKVRQPLGEITILKGGETIQKKEQELLEILSNEVNVHIINFKETYNESHKVGDWHSKVEKEYKISLNCEITDALKAEGIKRDLIRSIQEARKKNNLNPGDLVDIFIDTDNKKIIEIIKKNSKEISKTVNVKTINDKIIDPKNGYEFNIDNSKILVGIIK